MKVLITGAAGMLANDVCKVLVANGHNVIRTDLNLREKGIVLLDVRKLENVLSMVETIRPDWIFHLAAETDVDLCEQQPEHAFRMNTVGTENVALSALQYNIPLLYISTAGVFYGDKVEPYTEFDEPRPINVYGKTKLEGERVVQNLLNRHLIVRAGWMVGGWELDKKFVFKIIKQLKEGKKELYVVDDKFGSPTFTADFAANLLRLITIGRYGLYHMTNQGSASRYDIACEIVDILGHKNRIKVIPINSAQFPLPAPRARSEMMRNFKLDLLNINFMPHWKESLRRYVLASPPS